MTDDEKKMFDDLQAQMNALQADSKKDKATLEQSLKENEGLKKSNEELTKINSGLFLKVGVKSPEENDDKPIEDPLEFFNKHKDRYETVKGK